MVKINFKKYSKNILKSTTALITFHNESHVTRDYASREDPNVFSCAGFFINPKKKSPLFLKYNMPTTPRGK